MPMPRPRPPHLQREVTRHGKPVWYVRIGKGKRIRLHAEFGSADFEAEYQAAVNGRARPSCGHTRAESWEVDSREWDSQQAVTGWAATHKDTRHDCR